MGTSGTVDTILRSRAYDVISSRDGFSGWQTHRQRFRELLTYDRAQLDGFVATQVARLVTHAFETVPYYRESWSAVGFHPSADTGPADLSGLPLLRKAHIKDHKRDLVSQRYALDELDQDFTGGTGGTNTPFYRNHDCGVARLGRQWGVLERCGYRPGERRALFWRARRDLHPSTTRRLKSRFRAFGKAEEVLNCTAIDIHDMRRFHQRLLRFRPKVMYGYPNAIHDFARYVIDNALEPPRVDRVICTAERLTDAQRQMFEKVFGGEVFNLYCSREHGCVGFECSRHRGLHIDSGSVFVEVVRDGRPARPGEQGEVVTTDLLNYGMPLVRYVTGDLATVPDSACDCGLQLPTIQSLDGRVVDRLWRPDGVMVPGLMLAHAFEIEGFSALRATQFVQDTPSGIELRVVLEKEQPDLTIELRQRLEKQVRTFLGDEIAIDIRQVAEIPVNVNSGKFQEVISRVPVDSRPARGPEAHAG